MRMTMVCLALVTGLLASQSSIAAGESDTADDTIVDFDRGNTSSGWLPFEYFGGTRIFVQAKINGHPVTAMLDSGASATVIDTRFLQVAGLRSDGAQNGDGAGGGGAYGTVTGVDLSLGHLTIRGSPAVAIDLAAVEKQLGHPLPVILGGAVFDKTVVDIDFARRRIAFRNAEGFRAAPGARISEITRVGEIRAIQARIEGRLATLLFDIGNGGALTLYPRFWNRPEFLKDRRLSTTLAGGWGKMREQKLAKVRDVTIGGVTLRTLPTTLDDGSSKASRDENLDGNVGIRILSRFHLIVDFPHDRVLLDSGTDPSAPFPINRAGLTLQPSAVGTKVLYVAPQSPASVSGFAAGDEITAVRTDRDNPLNPGSGNWLTGPAGSTLTVRLADGSTRTLKLADYF